ncbi:MAG TPA: hypothetical protein VII56_09950 [Rhizomicrobium sp.]
MQVPSAVQSIPDNHVSGVLAPISGAWPPVVLGDGVDKAFAFNPGRLGMNGGGGAPLLKPAMPLATHSFSPTSSRSIAWEPARPAVQPELDAQPWWGSVVQREVLWGGTNHPDAELDAFVAALQDLVTDAAEKAKTPQSLDSGIPFYKRWQATALAYLQDNNDKAFLHARYGYAVETYVNENLSTLAATLPDGFTVHKQVTFGGSRPDVVVRDGDKNDIGWFDITSSGSVEHIYLKSHAGWKTRPYVAEITYPALDPVTISAGGALTAEQIEAAKLARQEAREEYLRKLLEVRKKAYLAKIGYGSKAKRRSEFEESLKDLFKLDTKASPKLAKAFVDLLFEEGTKDDDLWSYKAAFGYEAKKNPGRSVALTLLEGLP